MSKCPGRSSHSDRKCRLTLQAWPRLLSLPLAAAYCSVGARTVEDWIHDGILEPVRMPGSILKDKAGIVIAPSSRRCIVKTLIDRADLDALIEARKGAV